MVVLSLSVTAMPLAAGSSAGSYPIYEKMRVAPSATLMRKLPSMSVVTPFCAPFSTTDTPISGSPAESETVPVAIMLAKALEVPIKSIASKTARDFTRILAFSIGVILRL